MPAQKIPANRVKQVWQQAQQKLKQQLSPAAFNTWILANPLTELTITDNQQAIGTFATPTGFHATNLKQKLYSQLKSALEQTLNKPVELKFVVRDPAAMLAEQKSMNDNTANNTSRATQKTTQNTAYHTSNTSGSPSLEQAQKQGQALIPGDGQEGGQGDGQGGKQGQNQSQTLAQAVKNNDSSQSPSVSELFSQHNIQSMQQDKALTAARRAGLRLDYVFKNFAVSSSNELAHAAATAVSKRPGQAYNPLFLYGGVGVGKTHLMQAIGHAVLRREPNTKVLYCTGEEFTNEIINAIKTKKAIKFKKRYRNAQILLIDDIQFIAGKNTVQEEFFHTFNALVKHSAQIILTSDRPPQEIDLLEDRLKSRFEAGLMVDIQQPSLELRTAIVLIKAKANNLNFPIELAEMAASRVKSARRIEGFIALVRSAVELKGKELNQELINSILSKEEANNEKPTIRLKPDKIIKKVSSFYDLDVSTVKGKRRNKEFVKARHLAMFLLKTELDMSYVEIGRWFSNRDHTSVMHAKNKIEDLLGEENAIHQDYNQIRQQLIKLSPN
jgi:chromosomal replication initiator protein